jgi:hypothetical protein
MFPARVAGLSEIPRCRSTHLPGSESPAHAIPLDSSPPHTFLRQHICMFPARVARLRKSLQHR